MTTKEMNFTNMNIKDFIDYIITFDDVNDILENCKTQSKKGFIFERLFSIFTGHDTGQLTYLFHQNCRVG